MECYKLEHFERSDLKQADYLAWKDANEARLKEDEFLAALQLQLEYLVMSIQVQDVKETKDMGPLVATRGPMSFVSFTSWTWMLMTRYSSWSCNAARNSSSFSRASFASFQAR